MRKYFADKDRSAILRLSRDGITEISSYGMRKYFRDQLATINDDLMRRSVSIVQTIAPALYNILTLPNVIGIEIGAQLEIQYLTAGIVATNSIVTGITSSTTVTISPSYTIGKDMVAAIFWTRKRDKIYGGWDTHNKNYTLSLQEQPRIILSGLSQADREQYFNTLSFDENINGWTSFYSYQPIFINSLKNKFYTFIDSEIYEHYANIGLNHCKFYGRKTPDEANVKLVFNPNPSVKKNFNTISYEGDNGWEVESIYSSKQGFDNSGSSSIYQDSSNPIKSYDEGAYTERGINKHAGFDRKENRYVASIVNDSVARPEEVIFGSSMSGIKGYFTTVKFKVDSSTDVGGPKELFLAGSNYVMSSY